MTKLWSPSKSTSIVHLGDIIWGSNREEIQVTGTLEMERTFLKGVGYGVLVLLPP